MADKKISQLTGATTPLAGTEVLPIVQGGSTVKVSVANLTTGKAVTTGPLTAAQGMTNGSTAAFTTPHLALTATDSVNTTGFVGMTMATSDSTEYGYSYGALRDAGGVGDLIWKYHFGSAAGTEMLRLTYDGNLNVKTGNLVVGTSGKGIADSAGTQQLYVNTTGIGVGMAPTQKFEVAGAGKLGLINRAGSYTGGATTVAVGGVSYLEIANSGATSITAFTGASAGQVLFLKFNDGNTTITRNNAYLAGSTNFTSTTNATLTLIYDGAAWFEVCRSTTNG